MTSLTNTYQGVQQIWEKTEIGSTKRDGFNLKYPPTWVGGEVLLGQTRESGDPTHTRCQRSDHNHQRGGSRKSSYFQPAMVASKVELADTEVG